MKRNKFGLVLGGGAGRGVAHLGVIKCLEEENIKPDIIFGTSI
ncbi:MAG: patatin-like phospholipase family protein, partial [candidate division WOR-3 bacterium]